MKSATNTQTFGSRLCSIRKSKGLTQGELAGKLNVHTKSITNWELDFNRPSPQKIRKISEFFGVPVADLLAGQTADVLGEPTMPYQAKAGNDAAIRGRCRQHFDSFLMDCDTPEKLGWFLYELQEHFPLGKFKAAVDKSVDDEALRIMKNFGDEDDRTH